MASPPKGLGWVNDKHFFLTECINLSHGQQQGIIGSGKAGAPHIDLFCGLGQAKSKDSTQYMRGAALYEQVFKFVAGFDFSASIMPYENRALPSLMFRRNAPQGARAAAALAQRSLKRYPYLIEAMKSNRLEPENQDANKMSSACRKQCRSNCEIQTRVDH
jgi:hypothetical protein